MVRAKLSSKGKPSPRDDGWDTDWIHSGFVGSVQVPGEAYGARPTSWTAGSASELGVLAKGRCQAVEYRAFLALCVALCAPVCAATYKGLSTFHQQMGCSIAS